MPVERRTDESMVKMTSVSKDIVEATTAAPTEDDFEAELAAAVKKHNNAIQTLRAAIFDHWIGPDATKH